MGVVSNLIRKKTEEKTLNTGSSDSPKGGEDTSALNSDKRNAIMVANEDHKLQSSSKRIVRPPTVTDLDTIKEYLQLEYDPNLTPLEFFFGDLKLSEIDKVMIDEIYNFFSQNIIGVDHPFVDRCQDLIYDAYKTLLAQQKAIQPPEDGDEDSDGGDTVVSDNRTKVKEQLTSSGTKRPKRKATKEAPSMKLRKRKYVDYSGNGEKRNTKDQQQTKRVRQKTGATTTGKGARSKPKERKQTEKKQTKRNATRTQKEERSKPQGKQQTEKKPTKRGATKTQKRERSDSEDKQETEKKPTKRSATKPQKGERNDSQDKQKTKKSGEANARKKKKPRKHCKRNVESRPETICQVKDEVVVKKMKSVVRAMKQLQYMTTWESQTDRNEKPLCQHVQLCIDELVPRPSEAKLCRYKRQEGTVCYFQLPEGVDQKELGRLLSRVGKAMEKGSGKGYVCTENPAIMMNLVLGR